MATGARYNYPASLEPAGLLMDVGAPSVPPPSSAQLPVPSEPKKAVMAAPAESTPALGLPVLTAASVSPFGSTPLPVPTSSDPKKVQLAIVGPDEWGETDTSSPSAPTPNTAIPAAANVNAAAAPLVGNHDVREDPSLSPSPASPRQAGRETAAEVSSRGGYAVQVTSERSLAQAHASFRAIRAKFPNQLGGREPIVRRADLGTKGRYYRVMVGPFGSMEKAAGMCGTLKTAGCKCLVQRI
jgi:sporulation related protein